MTTKYWEDKIKEQKLLCKKQFDKIDLIKEKYKLNLKEYQKVKNKMLSLMDDRENYQKLLTSVHTSEERKNEIRDKKILLSEDIKVLGQKVRKLSDILEDNRFNISDEEENLEKLDSKLKMYETDLRIIKTR